MAKRVFLGWKQPAIDATADLLISEHRRGDWLDLTKVGIIVPGRRAGRRLRQRLTEKGAEAGLRFLPPRLGTPGGLPEWCYAAPRSIASATERQWSWGWALRTLSPSDRSLLTGIASRPGQPIHDRDYWPWPQILQGTSLELAASGFRFADIASRLDATVDATTREQWNILTKLEQAYCEVLQQQGLTDLQQARFQAIESNVCQLDLTLYLLATVELPQLTVSMLEQAKAPVTVLIFAPAEWHDRFDEYGRLVVDAWRSLPKPLPNHQWGVVRGPIEAAERVARFALESADDAPVVGIGDESILPHVHRALAMAGFPSRWGAGTSFQESSVWRLLALLRDYLRTPRLSEWTRLSRHPDVESWLLRHGVPSDFLSKVDHYFTSAPPGTRLPDSASAEFSTLAWSRAIAQLQQCLPAEVGSAVQHCRALSEFLRLILDGQMLEAQRPDTRKTLQAYQSLASLLSEVAKLSPEIAPVGSPADTVEWLLDELASASMPDDSSAPSIELLGWLELLLDDSPALCVTSFNEGFIPATAAKNDLLTSSLRESFRLFDEHHRFAREAYILSSFIATRSKLLMLVQRVGADDDPIQPSRLLFPDDPEEIARRWYRVLHEGAAEVVPPSESTKRNQSLRPAISQFTIPDLTPYTRPITQLSVTRFRSYLACPYRFFLEHVLKLSVVDSHPVELSASVFGDFAHRVLAQFGRSDRAHTTDENEILEIVMAYHHALAQQQFGDDPAPIVQLQLAQLIYRWRFFAKAQARHAQAGWVIRHIEQPERSTPFAWTVDQVPFGLIGRIDRIDVNSTTGQVLIIDYKTSDDGGSPDSTHRKKGKWIDLQLPLYRHLARDLEPTGPIQLAFFNLAKLAINSGIAMAEWSDDELQLADDAARGVIRKLREKIFFPPADPPPDFSEAWSWICLDNVRESITVPAQGH